MNILKSLWHSPPEKVTLTDNEVHVWRATLDWPVGYIQTWQQFLTTDEQQRADRFYFAKDRQSYVVARGLLRLLIGRYLQVDPHQLRFDYRPNGKPTLATTLQQARLHFNLSHSGDMVLYAFTLDREIGIDVERIRNNIEYEQIATHFFSLYEQAVLRTLPAELKAEAFITCWTRKEAYIKAKGEGLSMPLDQFDVSLRPGQPAKLLQTHDNPQEAYRWSLQELDVGSDYKAAVAVEGRCWQLCCWHFE